MLSTEAMIKNRLQHLYVPKPARCPTLLLEFIFYAVSCYKEIPRLFWCVIGNHFCKVHIYGTIKSLQAKRVTHSGANKGALCDNNSGAREQWLMISLSVEEHCGLNHGIFKRTTVPDDRIKYILSILNI